MNEALECVYYILNGFLEFFFGSYIFTGVSLGMIFISAFVFTVLLKFLVAIPKVRVGGSPPRDKED